MIICEVIGHVWSTRKEITLEGLKFMVVQPLEDWTQATGPSLVAADIIGAGIGEKVLVVQGSTARKALGNDTTPVDATIVGIIDSVEIDKMRAAKRLVKRELG